MTEGIFIDEDTKPTTTTATTIVSNIVGIVDDDHYKFIPTATLLPYDPADQFDNKMAKYYRCLSLIEFYKEHLWLLLQSSFYLDSSSMMTAIEYDHVCATMVYKYFYCYCKPRLPVYSDFSTRTIAELPEPSTNNGIIIVEQIQFSPCFSTLPW